MENANPDARLKIVRLALIAAVILFAAFVGFMTWLLTAAQTDMQVEVESLSPNIFGSSIETGSCDLETNLFDSSGNLFVFPLGQNGPDERNAYIGAAPLYGFNQTTAPRFDYLICNPPHSILAADAVQGQPHYPLVVTVMLDDKKVAQGEGGVLGVTAVIEEIFTTTVLNEKVVYTVPLHLSGELPLSFDLNTTTFRFSPTNAEAATFILTQNRAGGQKWSITPTETAVGKQTILIDPEIVLADGTTETLNSIQLNVIVSENRAVLSMLITALTTIVSLGTAMLGAVKLYNDWKKSMANTAQREAQPTAEEPVQ